jgi:hypothetical protein
VIHQRAYPAADGGKDEYANPDVCFCVHMFSVAKSQPPYTVKRYIAKVSAQRPTVGAQGADFAGDFEHGECLIEFADFQPAF